MMHQNIINFQRQNFITNNQKYGYFPNNPPRPPPGRNSFHKQYRKPLNPNYNEEHWCETCDRGFPTLDLLEKHKQQHQKCNIDGCQFIAHPKVITKHIQMQHSSGLYQKIAKLNNPEEIQKWREERKRKYPTRVNIDKKAAEVKEKIKRGEKMGLHQNKHRNSNNTFNGPNRRNVSTERNHQRNRRHNPYPTTLNLPRKSTVPKKVHNVLPTTDTSPTLKPFAGIQDIVIEDTLEDTLEETKCDFVIDDDDDDDMVKIPEPEKLTYNENDTKNLSNDKPKVCGALSSLICNYETSEEETDVANGNASRNPVKAVKITPANKLDANAPVLEKVSNSMVTKPNEQFTENSNKSDDDAPEEVKIDKVKDINTPDEPAKLVKPSRVKQFPIVNKRYNFVKPKPKIPSTLLQKLLKREIRKERNIVLQCIRHIVKNNFFDKPSQ